MLELNIIQLFRALYSPVISDLGVSLNHDVASLPLLVFVQGACTFQNQGDCMNVLFARRQ